MRSGARAETARRATDDHRIRCYEYVVDVLRKHRVVALRAAYFKRSLAWIVENQPEKIRRRMRYSLCFGGLEATIGQHPQCVLRDSHHGRAER
jgi:hypothetical protein